MLVATVGIVFSIIAPLVLVPAAIFFLLSRIIWTHQFLYCYESVFETGGIFWPKVFRRYIFALLVSQATIVGGERAERGGFLPEDFERLIHSCSRASLKMRLASLGAPLGAPLGAAFLLKKATYQAYCLIVLMGITYQAFKETRKKFDTARVSSLPLEVATIMDSILDREGGGGGGKGNFQVSERAYIHYYY